MFILRNFIFKTEEEKMARLNKSYFYMFKKKSLIFEEVKFNEDIRVQIVKALPDYKVMVLKKKPNTKDTIKVKFVNSGADVKLQVVDNFGDFSIFMK